MVVRLLVLLGLALAAAPHPAAASDDQVEVLLEFAMAARGDAEGTLADWRRGTDPCTWSGVGCTGGTVTSLRLPRSGLRGTLDPGLARLASLRQIDLSGNALEGRLPARWARLDDLERLNLNSNSLTGPLPPTWNTLEGLKYLSLAGNALNGSLPVAWSSLGQLYLLDLSSNRLSGPLPGAWARQRWLFRLALARNALTGSLPPQWGRLRGLLQLDLGTNQLTGNLPPQWGELRQATAVDLSANLLNGPLPPQWAGLASLQMLALQGNQLSGVVPAQWTALADRTYRLSLGDNPQLCGAVPQPLAAAVLAAGASSRGSGLAEPCPWQADAEALLAFKDGIVGAPASALSDWTPQGGNPCSNESWSGVSCRGGRVAILNLAHQGLRFITLEPLGRLGALEKVLLVGNAAANATLPALWAGLRQLAAIDLSGAGVSGSLPASWGQLHALKQLRLGGNSLNSTLPASWASLGSLTTLDLAQNALTGGLPPEWGALPSLASLDASGNYLSGGLPEAWFQLANLQELQLASNNLKGAIPTSWARLPSLTLLELGSNVGLCGSQPDWRAGTQMRAEATNLGQSCIMVQTSGAVAGVVLGVSLSVTLASLAAAGTLMVYMRRQRAQLAVLQRERSAASFTTFPSFDGGSFNGGTFAGKLAHQLHTFSATAAGAGGEGVRPGRTPPKPFKALSIPNPWDDEQGGGYIQVPLATPGSRLPVGPARTPSRSGMPLPEEEHRSPSPTQGMPSPERHQWQVAVQAVDRGVDLTARRSRQKRLFRSRSDAPFSLAAAAGELSRQVQERQAQEGEWPSDSAELEMARAHSRVALLPPDGGMV